LQSFIPVGEHVLRRASKYDAILEYFKILDDVDGDLEIAMVDKNRRLVMARAHRENPFPRRENVHSTLRQFI